MPSSKTLRANSAAILLFSVTKHSVFLWSSSTSKPRSVGEDTRWNKHLAGVWLTRLVSLSKSWQHPQHPRASSCRSQSVPQTCLGRPIDVGDVEHHSTKDASFSPSSSGSWNQASSCSDAMSCARVSGLLISERSRSLHRSTPPSPLTYLVGCQAFPDVAFSATTHATQNTQTSS